MRIGFFGGSFDPPHRGHLAIAQAAADRCRLDRVLLAPTARQPLKPQGAEASFAERLEMVRLLCVGDAQLEASAADAPRQDGKPNYTVDTLGAIRDRLNAGESSGARDSFVVVVGIDAFLDIPRWHAPKKLLRDFDWAVVSRPGRSLAEIDAMDLTADQRARVQVLDGLAESASATAIREALRDDRDTSAMLPPAVLAYIRERGLYGA
jgi:nicotinate-nucleotide adenylyltransferase